MRLLACPKPHLLKFEWFTVRSHYCLVFLLAGVLGAAQPAGSLFPDTTLEAVVRSHVFAKRDNKEPLAEADVKTLSSISGKGKAVRSLAGLEKCSALALLELTGGEIADLSPIKDLTNIQSLTLAHNKIKDISALAGLTNLQYLDLTGNEVSDLRPLANLKSLNSLYLSSNKIADLSPLAGLERVWSLYLDGNLVTDLKPVAGMKWLSSLDLKNNKVADLSPLSPLTSLHYLFLDGNPVQSLAPLVAMGKKDTEAEKRFAPFWTVSLSEKQLGGGKRAEMAELKKYSHTVLLNK